MESNGALIAIHGYTDREPKELDLIGQLDHDSGYESDESVDLTLTLAIPSAKRAKKPVIDVPNNIHATSPPQVYIYIYMILCPSLIHVI